MKSPYIYSIVLTAAVSAVAAHENSEAISADVNCDGKADTAKLEYTKNEVKIVLTEGFALYLWEIALAECDLSNI